MKCRKCDRDLVEQAKFCSYCGEQAAVACSSCGVLNPADGLFCHDCGRGLVGEEVPSEHAQSEPERSRTVGLRCPRCQTTNEPGSAHCYHCGLPLEEGSIEGYQGHTAEPWQGMVRCRVPPQRVLIMSVVSVGLYLLYWFYLTWKHLRDNTGREAYPIWHALTIFVPIYSLFRIHAHMRVYRELMYTQNLATSISPGWAVVTILVLDVLSIVIWNLPTTRLGAQIQVYLVAATAVIVAWLLLQAQSNLNRYWTHVFGSVDSTPIGFVEILLAVIGILVWLAAISSVAG